MICRCFGHDLDTSELIAAARRAAWLIAGVADYDAYVTHMADTHPEQAPMDRATFLRNRQLARYGAGGGLRCC